MVRRFLYPKELITCKGGNISHIIRTNGQRPSLWSTTGYLILGVKSKMKTGCLLFRSYEDVQQAASEHEPKCRAWRCSALSSWLVHTASSAPWQQWTASSRQMGRASRHTKLRSIFPRLWNKDLCYFTSKMSPLFCTLTTHIYHFLMCLCSVFYFPHHFKTSHLTTSFYPRRLTSCNNL